MIMKENEIKSCRILIADDHKLFREGIRKILELEEDMMVCGEAYDGEEVLEKVKLLKPGVILMDINMPSINGVEATRAVKEVYPDTEVIALTVHDDEEYLFEIVKEGASGFILKDVETSTLLEAIREVTKGNCYIQPSITTKLIGGFNRMANKPTVPGENEAPQNYYGLTTRELEALELLAKGFSNYEISLELNISEKTVKNHVSNILRKLEVSDRTQAVVTALKLEIVEI